MGTELHDREVRAARNQALFRAVNEKMRKLNEDVASLTGSFTIACECSDTECVAMIEISADDYLSVRSEPRRFVVLPGHIVAKIETVVREGAAWVVVEKTEAIAAHVPALADERTGD
jgi:hypothetical protein